MTSTPQLVGWLVLANARQHRRIGCAPNQRWATDLAATLALPPVAPTIGWRAEVRLPRDYYVRLDSNDYSVDPTVIGRRVAVSADLDTVRVRQGGRLVAEHQRCWAKHQSITDATTRLRWACRPRPARRCRPRRQARTLNGATWAPTTPRLA